ncbi:MAG: S-layer homology domain-containing protein [Clostridiales bacterium]|nr:S-layer homology domain-containing protein [Clostridiales bacterium]
MKRFPLAVMIPLLAMAVLFFPPPVALASVAMERPDPSAWPDEVKAWVEEHLMEPAVGRYDGGGYTWLMVTWGQKPTSGYQIFFRVVTEIETGLEAWITASRPAPDAMVLQVLTYPRDVVRIPLTDRPIAFRFVGTDDRFKEDVLPKKPSSPGKDFPDMERHWAKDQVRQAVELGIIMGYPDGTFRPDRPVTWAEFIRMTVRAFHLPVPEGAPTRFDVPQDFWAREDIAAAEAAGLLAGETPLWNEPIPRLAMVRILLRELQQLGYSLPEGGPLPFTDTGGLPLRDRERLSQASQLGLVKGYPDGRFRPEGASTRAEAVQVLLRALALAQAPSS